MKNCRQKNSPDGNEKHAMGWLCLRTKVLRHTGVRKRGLVMNSGYITSYEEEPVR